MESNGGKDCVRGKSGEIGCYQILESNWAAFSMETIGYVAPHTEINEEYVAMVKFQKWLDKGMTPSQVAMKWNQGGGDVCRKGVNSKGVRYDSCEYVKITMGHYNTLPEGL